MVTPGTTRPAAESAEQIAPRTQLDGDELADVLAEERALDASRLGFVLTLGAVLWLIVGVAYVPIAFRFEPRPLAHFLVPHAIGWTGLLLARRAVQRPNLAVALGLLVPAMVTAFVSAFHRGIVSPFGHGTVVLIAAYAMALPMPWRRTWPWLLLLWLSWPLGLLACTRWFPALGAQLGDPRLRADFQETALAQLVAAILAGAGQHAQWTTRREVLAQQVRHRYRIIDKLGEGGMGEVWRAHHPGLGRDVALKILRQSGDAQLVERFVREVRATAELAHPGIVRIFDCGATKEGHLFYAMELLSGRTLADIVARRGRLGPERSAYLVREAARALAEAHDKGLVHRDVKPENLFLADVGGEHDVVKVLDFGIAKSLSSDTRLTVDGALLGTPRYMSLEQALGAKVDVRADVYALGAVLYYALTGVPPIGSLSVGAIVAAHTGDLIAPPRELVSSIPESLERVVLRCLRSRPEDRFEDARTLARALDDTGLPDRHRPGAEGSAPVAHATRDVTLASGSGRQAVTEISGGRP